MIDPADMSIDHHGAVVVVRLEGEVDMGNADRLGRRVVNGVLDIEPPAAAVALDLSALAYVDSSGLRMLEEIRHSVTSKGLRSFTIAPETCLAYRLLSLTGLTEHLATRPDLDGGAGGRRRRRPRRGLSAGRRVWRGDGRGKLSRTSGDDASDGKARSWRDLGTAWRPPACRTR